MLSLKDALGTRYACDWLASDICQVLDKYVGEEIDIGDMGFTPQAYKCIIRYSSLIKFRNLKNPELDAVLQHNREAKKLLEMDEGQEVETLQVEFENLQGIVKYIQGLQKGARLSIPNITKTQVAFNICHLIVAFRPDVLLDFGSELAKYFQEVRRMWLPYAGHWDAYWQVVDCTLVRREVRDGMVQVSTVESISEEEYRCRFTVLPCAFGQSGQIVDNAEFKRLFDSAVDYLNSVCRPTKRMYNFLYEERGRHD